MKEDTGGVSKKAEEQSKAKDNKDDNEKDKEK